MNTAEFVIRSMIVGFLVGAPAYFLGSRYYSGHRIPKLAVAGIGGMAGLVAGFGGFAGAIPWVGVVGISIILAVIGAVVFSLLPASMDHLSPRRRK